MHTTRVRYSDSARELTGNTVMIIAGRGVSCDLSCMMQKEKNTITRFFFIHFQGSIATAKAAS